MNDDNQDNYRRSASASSMGQLVPLVHNVEPPSLGYSPEWWEQRDREVADQRAKDVAANELSRMAGRAGELRDHRQER